MLTEAGEELGKVVQVFSTAHNAAVQVEDPAGNFFSVPLIDKVVLAMNLEKGEITVGDLAPYRVDDAD
jgi:ribosomal 30S subunit maturation factor RimM